MTGNADLNEGPTHWVFGYGSLIWHPGFPVLRQSQALLKGAHRSLCIYSNRHRGTDERPGLVFGLMRGGSCRGMAFEISDAEWPDTREYLRRREQQTNVYRPTERTVRLLGGETVLALTFVVDENHPQFAGSLPIEEQLAIVRGAHGESGANSDYVIKTVEHLLAMGIRDRQMMELSDRLKALEVAA